MKSQYSFPAHIGENERKCRYCSFWPFFAFLLHRATTHRTPVAQINNLMINSRRFAYFVKLTFSFFSNFLGPVAQWIRHLTTNQGIPGSSPCRVDFVDSSLFEGILNFLSLTTLHNWPCSPMVKVSDYESGDSRLESWQGRFC